MKYPEIDQALPKSKKEKNGGVDEKEAKQEGMEGMGEIGEIGEIRVIEGMERTERMARILNLDRLRFDGTNTCERIAAKLQVNSQHQSFASTPNSPGTSSAS